MRPNRLPDQPAALDEPPLIEWSLIGSSWVLFACGEAVGQVRRLKTNAKHNEYEVRLWPKETPMTLSDGTFTQWGYIDIFSTLQTAMDAAERMVSKRLHDSTLDALSKL